MLLCCSTFYFIIYSVSVAASLSICCISNKQSEVFSVMLITRWCCRALGLEWALSRCVRIKGLRPETVPKKAVNNSDASFTSKRSALICIHSTLISSSSGKGKKVKLDFFFFFYFILNGTDKKGAFSLYLPVPKPQSSKWCSQILTHNLV